MEIKNKREFFANYIIIYEKQLGNYIYKRIYNHYDAADILQTTFLNAWKSLDQLRSVETARSWLYAIADNCINAYFRRNATQQKYLPTDDSDDPQVLLADIYEEEDSVLGEIMEHFETTLAFQALKYLSPQDKELIHMRYIAEIGTKRMVAVTGLKEKTLSSKLSRALKKYKQIYFALEAGEEVSIKNGHKK